MQRTRGFESVENWARKSNGEVILPIRSTKHSAGYDFVTTEDVTLEPNEQLVVWSDVKAYMQENEVLELYVRSSLGIKQNVILANVTGIIDSDYYSNPNNDGNIGICLRNIGTKLVTLQKGERVAQGIFKTYLVADNCNSENDRVGGIGSTK